MFDPGSLFSAPALLQSQHCTVPHFGGKISEHTSKCRDLALKYKLQPTTPYTLLLKAV
uniref:Uncharacterized protein n=1 Tax=Anguilla anguilla TaxID=7936 RepID=A0A0E9X4D8_ANGAN